MASHKQFTWDEIAKHNKPTDCWIVIDNRVYDMTSFLNDHPGGKAVVVKVGGTDATKQFNMFHKPAETLRKYGPKLFIGVVAGAGKTPAPTVTEKKIAAPISKSEQHVGTPFKVVTATQSATATASDQGFKVAKTSSAAFGEQIPYGDPSWYQDWHSPYFTDSHRRFRAAVRELVENEMMPHAHEWDEAKQFPKPLFKKIAESGLLGAAIGAPWNTKYAGSRISGGVKPEEFDSFHDLIMIDELSRCGSGGLLWGLFGGLSIGLPPVIQFGDTALADRIAPACLRGEKVICLAITEPDAGSDVANLKTTAVKTEDGKHYIVNGSKKWITNGVFADYFTVAVRTGGKGMGGVSLLLVERKFPGVTTRQMQCSGVWSSGTTYITFEDVKVPVENLIGQENFGFMYVMYNFNHERWATAVQALRFSRVCLEESLKYSLKRETFGKKLIEHPVIRLKMAHMARQIEATQAWLESITYQMKMMSHKEQQKRLGGPIALLKAQCTTCFEYCAREAAQIFGGLAYTRGGQGEKVERLYREVRAYAIPAGSEEIMLDLGIREALKKRMPVKKAKL